MSRLETPTDELTGVPLPILPQAILPINTGVANFHHPWHPKPVVLVDPPRTRDYGVRGLRNSRLQLVSRVDHAAYHGFFEGPVWPTTVQEQFDLCVFGVAGYIPAEAIDVRGDSPERVAMQSAELDILRTPAEPRPLRPEKEANFRVGAHNNPDREDSFEKRVADYHLKEEQWAAFTFHHITYVHPPVRNFLQRFVLVQEVEPDSEIMTEEFILTGDPERRRSLGTSLLRLRAEAAAGRVKPIYVQAWQAGRLHPRMPREPAALVESKLGGPAARLTMINELKEKLMDEAGITPYKSFPGQ